MGSTPYTRIPRTTLWLLRGGDDVRPFYIGKAPITNEEYEAYDPSHRRAPTSPNDRDPVVLVSIHDALGYCHWYAEASGKPFRLASGAEWEFACRAGSQTRYFWGDDPVAGDPYLWDAETSGARCHEVETSKANAFGLHDLLGNVWEWTGSLHVPDPGGPAIARGGSFRTPRSEIDCALCLRLDPSDRRDDLGFRIARYL
jgi:formylglycine-generating enzyme required for sulfatase activity